MLGARSWQPVDAGQLNGYLRQASGQDISAKDFRTWHATVLTAVGLAVSWPAAQRSQAARRRACARVVREIASYLGNTPAVCRASYINPRLFELYDQGVTIASTPPEAGADPLGPGLPGTGEWIEHAVIALLSS
ncbi:hypothetical protein [Kitasatospora sp. NPDC054795]